MLKKIGRAALPVLDPLFAAALLPAAVLMRLFRRLGAARLPLSRALLERVGVYPILDHYYEPLFSRRSLPPPPMIRSRPEIDLLTDEQCAFLDVLVVEDASLAINPHEHQLAPRPLNGSFERADWDFLNAFLRTVRPRRLIEIGSGESTKLAVASLERNARDGYPCQHICIEPFEAPWLEQLPVDVIRRPVEQCDLEIFSALEAGDLLFIDSSHIIRPGGDVLFEFLTLLPMLQPGVYVHIHDVYTPRDYPFTDPTSGVEVRFWNEQYLLEALLLDRSRYRPIAALNLLKHERYEALARICPHISADHEPGSFYLQIRN